MTICQTHRPVPCSATIREASSSHRWEQTQRPTGRHFAVSESPWNTDSPNRSIKNKASGFIIIKQGFPDTAAQLYIRIYRNCDSVDRTSAKSHKHTHTKNLLIKVAMVMVFFHSNSYPKTTNTPTLQGYLHNSKSVMAASFHN